MFIRFIKVTKQEEIQHYLDCHLFNKENGFVPSITCKNGAFMPKTNHKGFEVLEGANVISASTDCVNNIRTYHFKVDANSYQIQLNDILFLELLEIPQEPKKPTKYKI